MDKIPELIFTSDGFRTIMNEPWECPGCFSMHYFFILTVDGHRCLDCVKTVASFAPVLPRKPKNDKNLSVFEKR